MQLPAGSNKAPAINCSCLLTRIRFPCRSDFTCCDDDKYGHTAHSSVGDHVWGSTNAVGSCDWCVRLCVVFDAADWPG